MRSNKEVLVLLNMNKKYKCQDQILKFNTIKNLIKITLIESSRDHRAIDFYLKLFIFISVQNWLVFLGYTSHYADLQNFFVFRATTHCPFLF